jgi:hypothetical protein
LVRTLQSPIRLISAVCHVGQWVNPVLGRRNPRFHACALLQQEREFGTADQLDGLVLRKLKEDAP